MLKFFIVGETGINKEEIIDLLEMNNDSEQMFKIAKIFTTDYDEANQKYWYYISNEDLNICYKNNAILFIKTIVNKSYGITLESFYDSNILFMDTENFNNISNKIFLGNDELVLVWLDTKNHDKKNIKKEINETNYLIYFFFFVTVLRKVADIYFIIDAFCIEADKLIYEIDVLQYLVKYIKRIFVFF